MDNFVNPFEQGVNYAEFEKALGNKKIETYCKGKLSKEQIDFLVEDFKHYLNNKNK
jgi:hypothetical protein